MNKLNFLFIIFAAVPALLSGQQVADTSWNFAEAQPRFAAGAGAMVWIDAAHHNFHTLSGQYGAFGRILRADGFQVSSNDQPFSAASLKSCNILVISNALDSSNIGNWNLPTPSAFSSGEMVAVENWVKQGGRLLLIADHMPFAGAAHDLAARFGFEFENCFAFDMRNRNTERFLKSNKTLADNEITRGVDTVVTFTGSAFKAPKGAKPILTLKNYMLSMPQTAWNFEEDTPVTPADGYLQGAYMLYGKGRIVVTGEAAMFTAQLVGPRRNPIGLNAPEARQNNELLLNIMHWLAE